MKAFLIQNNDQKTPLHFIKKCNENLIKIIKKKCSNQQLEILFQNLQIEEKNNNDK